MNKKESMTHIKKKITAETIPEKNYMVDILVNEFKTTILKILKELMKDIKLRNAV